MRRVRFLPLTILLLAMVVAGMAWVIGTTAGARWLLESLSKKTAAEIRVRTVEGRLLDRLNLAGMRIGLAQQRVEIDRLDLDWKLLHLLLGRVDISKIAVVGVRIQDDAAPTPLSLDWPQLPKMTNYLSGKIGHLTLRGLTYRKGEEKPVIVQALSASARLQGGNLDLISLQGAMPSVRMEGSIGLGLIRPSLTTNLTVYPKEPLGGMQRFVLQTSLKPAKGPEQAAGAFTFSGEGKTADQPSLALSGEAGVERKALHFRHLIFIGGDLRGTITGGATIDFSALDPFMKIEIQAAGVDLAPQIGMATNIEGALSFSGTTANYRGRFSVANTGSGWRSLRFSGDYAGHEKEVELTTLTGTILAGTVGGNLKVDWKDEIRLEGALRGRNLNPAVIMPDWTGQINFNLAGNLTREKDASVKGNIEGTLLESRLHGRALRGDVRGAFAGDMVHVDSLNLHGKGFSVHAAGEFEKRLALKAKIDDLSRLVPGASGTLIADGWVRRDDSRLSGAVNGQGRALAMDGTRIGSADLNVRLGPKPDDPLHVSATLRTVAYKRFRAKIISLEASGTDKQHTIHAMLRNPGAEVLLQLSGGYSDGWWRGNLLRFSGHDSAGPWRLAAPVTLALGKDRISLGLLVLRGTPGEHIEAAADLFYPNLRGNASLRVDGLNLARINPWLTEVQVSGVANGKFRLDLASKDHLSAAAEANLRGSVNEEGKAITVQRLDAAFKGNERGLSGSFDMRLDKEGILNGSLACTFPARSFTPDRGEAKINWSHLDLSLVRPWLPRKTGVDIQGHLAGGITGVLFPAKRFELSGTACLAQGRISGRKEKLDVSAHIDKAEISWSWREDALSGTTILALAEHGQARGRFRLPIPARLPVAVNPQGKIEAVLTGQIQEKGLLTALFPGVVQETQGELNFDVVVGGRWNNPQMTGKIRLAKAGAYIPSAGIHVKDVQLAGHIEKDAISIDSFRAVSGPGYLAGTAYIRLKDWQLSGYRITVAGERFRTVYFPELQLYSSPRLTFEGTTKKLAIRGEVHLPEVHITGSPVRGVVTPSPDVRIEGLTPAEPKGFPLDVDLHVRVTSGNRVFVKLEGIDAQLGGALQLTALHRLDRISSTGEIRVVKGRFQSYGVTLEIVRGRLFYAGGPIDKPALDILALRKADSAKAGATVTGTLQSPVITLYSEPPMQDEDILSYIVLGHPLSGSGEHINLLTMAAEGLLSAGQSVVLQDKIANRLGLSSFEISTRSPSVSAWDAYTAGPLTSGGSATAASGSDISRAMMTIGKYLTPKLYVSYGRSVFTGSNLFLLRYDLHRNWQVETQTGTENGIDLYYKIEFK
ncbi:MAG: Translocation and assembly module TamB [Syntrophus sp. PtaU1.Bin208]|nr:MAG: Translocation and assembly module TamB [Syntrophus sp. PtaU1.Bin208]